MATLLAAMDSELRPQSQRLAGTCITTRCKGRRSNRAVPTPGPCTRTGCECAGQRVRACVVGTARNSISNLVARQTTDVPQTARGKGPDRTSQGQQPVAAGDPGTKKNRGRSICRPALAAGHRDMISAPWRPGPQRSCPRHHGLHRRWLDEVYIQQVGGSAEGFSEFLRWAGAAQAARPLTLSPERDTTASRLPEASATTAPRSC